MKTFWKLILILWALTYSPEHSQKENSNNSCLHCLSKSEKTTQTCDACTEAKPSTIT